MVFISKEKGFKLKEELVGIPYSLIPFFESKYNGEIFFYKISPQSKFKKTYYLYAPLNDSYYIYPSSIRHKAKIISQRQFLYDIESLSNIEISSEYELPYNGGLLYTCSYEFAEYFEKFIKIESKAQKRSFLSLKSVNEGSLLASFCFPTFFYLFDSEKNELLSCRLSSKNNLTIQKENLPIMNNQVAVTGTEAKKKLPSALVNGYFKINSYKASFGNLKKYFLNGDIYQIILASKVTLRLKTGFDFYSFFSDLANHYKDAKFSFLFRAAGKTFFGNCALPHLLKTNEKMHTLVFAGTKPAAKSETERLIFEKEFRKDGRFQSEHNMLVDLERNDIGRIAKPGSVKIESYLTAKVIGATTYLSTEVSGLIGISDQFLKLLMTNFPRGVVTGAPKQKAREIIFNMEKKARGFYTGCIGILDGKSKSIISNTIVTCGIIDNNKLTIPVASGVLLKSNSLNEINELKMKARIFLAVALKWGAR